MATPLIVLDSIGPLPLDATFKSPGVGEATLYVTGSAYGQVANEPIQVDVEMEGQVVGHIQLFANEANSHKALVAKYFNFELPPWPTTEPPTLNVRLTTGNPNTVTDDNDNFQVVLLG